MSSCVYVSGQGSTLGERNLCYVTTMKNPSKKIPETTSLIQITPKRSNLLFIRAKADPFKNVPESL